MPETTTVETVATEPIVGGFAALSDNALIEQTINADTTTTTTEQTPVAPVVNADGTTTPVTPITPVAKTDDVVEDDKPIVAFKIPGVEDTTTVTKTPEQIAQEAAITALETEQNWINLAKVKGVEITEDSFDAYNKALDTKYETDLNTKIEAVRQEKIDLELNKLPIEAVAIIEGIKEGLTYEDVMAPVKAIEGLLALTNEELVAEDLRLQGWEETLIDKKIADLIETDRLDVEAQPLRVILNNNKKVVAQNQVDKFTQMQQQRVEHEKQVRAAESETIKNTITSMKEYMGVPITPELVNYVTQKWNKGEYHESLKDSKKIADFIMNEEFGEQGKKALAKREYDRGLAEKANKLHNIPPVSKTGTVVIPQTSTKAEGNFGALGK